MNALEPMSADINYHWDDCPDEDEMNKLIEGLNALHWDIDPANCSMNEEGGCVIYVHLDDLSDMPSFQQAASEVFEKMYGTP